MLPIVCKITSATIILSALISATADAKWLLDPFLNKKHSVFFYKDAIVPAIPTCKNRKCLAVRYLMNVKQSEITFTFKPGGNNPAWEICMGLRGTPKIYKDEELNDISICGFDDGSFFNTWGYIKLLDPK
ncbi:MAG: hypothetical protein ACXVCY_11055 [Pseudobdellovibrionaceae bacterium]